MTSFLNIYNDIEKKLDYTTSQLVELQEEIKKLKKENETLKQQGSNVGEKGDFEKILSQNTETHIYTHQNNKNNTLYEIKEEINEIVREIDNCIGILNAE